MNRHIETKSTPSAVAPLREIIFDCGSGGAAQVEKEKPPEMKTVAQTETVEGKDNQTSSAKDAVPPSYQGTAPCDRYDDDELSANLRGLLRLNQSARRNSVADTVPSSSTGTAPAEKRSPSVDHLERNMSPSMTYLRSASLRSMRSTTDTGTIGLQDLRSKSLRSINAAEQEEGIDRRWSLVQQGRQPSLRRRHSICYSVLSCSAEQESSTCSSSNYNRRASMSTCGRSDSLSTIITECHPLSVGMDFLSESDDSDSDEDSDSGGEADTDP